VADFPINYRSRWAVASPVRITLVLREEPDVVPLADNDHGDRWVDVELLASI
jgi:hypothetical protein